MLNPRVFDLLETLNAADLDWLAQEVLEGALAGHVPDEPNDVLQRQRAMVFRERQDQGLAEFSPESKEVEAFSLNEQIDWATDYVVQRLADMVKMLRVSSNRLNDLIASTHAGKHVEGPNRTELILYADTFESSVKDGNLAAGELGLIALKNAIEQWREGLREGSVS